MFLTELFTLRRLIWFIHVHFETEYKLKYIGMIVLALHISVPMIICEGCN